MNNSAHDCVNIFLNDITMAFVNIKTMLVKDKEESIQFDILCEVKQNIIDTQSNIFEMENRLDKNEMSHQVLWKMRKDLICATEGIARYANSIK